ncbi:MAG: FecR domain-containing protein [Myxococcota bacterium]
MPNRQLLSFQAGDASESGRIGAYYTASSGTPLSLRFVDGSNVRIDSGGGLRVSHIGREQVSVQLETGSADFDIVPRRGVAWNVLAGPYCVHVTGTSFRLSWDSGAQALELQMHSGAVLVSGPGLESGQRVGGTQRFTTRVTTSRSELGVANSENAEAAASLPRAPASSMRTEAAPPRPLRAPAPAAVSARPPSEVSELREPLRTPQTTEAPAGNTRPHAAFDVKAAEAMGVDRALATASAEQLLSLADSARFARRGDLAVRALRSVRTRFAGSTAAAGAAFLLGRLAEDSGKLREAVTLYDQHARESGQLVPEALGRKMLVLHRLHDTTARNRAANEYLQRFPEGTYARQAKELLSH